VAAFILANAYFVATEFSLVAVRRTQVNLWVTAGRRGAKSAAHAIQHLDDAIAATQLGITLASIGLGWIGEPAIAGLVEPLIRWFGIGSTFAIHGVAVAIAFAFITFLHVVLGELAPKALALDRPGAVVLACARPLLTFASVFRPILKVMNGAGNAVVRGFGIRPAGKSETVHSPDEISMLIDEARDAGKIRPYAGQILGNVFRLTKTRVRDVMVERSEVLAIDQDLDSEKLLDLLRGYGFTRIPVYSGDLDRIVGILHAKDLFHIYARDGVIVLKDAIRPAMEISEDLPVVDALRRFRRDRKHLAIVRGREGALVGVCTLEDVLEEIVGEIEDEFDRPTPAGSA